MMILDAVRHNRGGNANCMCFNYERLYLLTLNYPGLDIFTLKNIFSETLLSQLLQPGNRTYI